MQFPRQEYWRGMPFLFAGDLPNPGIEPTSPALAGGFFTTVPLGDPVSGSCTFKRNRHKFSASLVETFPQQQSWHPGPWKSHMSTEWKGQRVPCGEQSANLLPAGVGNCGVPSVPCQPACDSQRLLWASKCGMPTWDSRPLPQICSWKVWVDVSVALRLTGCTQSVEVMLILFWKGHWPLRIWKENGRALFPSLISWSLIFG